MHRPQWVLPALWDLGRVTVEEVQPLPRHPALRDAGQLLGKELTKDMQ